MIVRVPGDKSLTQRALIFAALADGESRLAGLLYGGDAASTAGALRALGAEIPELPTDGGEFRVRGVGLRGLVEPADPLDLGNSGTGTRLLSGALAGAGLEATMTGDASLRTRPMRRVTEPLSAMGARFDFLEGEDRLPMRVHGAHPLRAIEWTSPVASAQVKSAILLAGLTGSAPTAVSEPRQSRDHTERMLQGLGVSIVSGPTEQGWRVESAQPPKTLSAFDFHVPGDVSSASFLLALAALGGTPGGVTVECVGLNPTRTAFLEVLGRMGSRIETEQTDDSALEVVGAITAHPASLRGATVQGAEIPRLIDELPMIAALGAVAEGETVIRDAEELRAKETDRISAMAVNLRSVGVEAEELPDGLIIRGTDRPLRGSVQAFHDHRIAMAFGVLGAREGNAIDIDDPGVASVSFPGFWELLRELSTARAP